jgi:hypothetical protein
MVDYEQLENMEYFSCFGTVVINYKISKSKIKSRIAMAKAAFNEKKNLFTSKLYFNLRKKTSEVPHLEHNFMWS